MLSGCTISENQLEERNSETYIAQSESSTSDKISSLETPIEIEKTDLVKKYSFENIRNILESNPYLSQEEKELIYKLQFVFDEYHFYMNLETVEERLATLSIEYQKDFFSSTGGSYDYINNKLVLNASNFEDISIGKFLHEFFHVLQSEIRGYGYFCCELSNEFFTREFYLDYIMREF